MAQSIAKTMHKDGIYSAEEVINKMMSISTELTRTECHGIRLNIVQQAKAADEATPAAKSRPSGNKMPKANDAEPQLDVSCLQSDGDEANSGNQSSDDEGLLDTVLSTADQFQSLAENGDGAPQTMSIDQYILEFTSARAKDPATSLGDIASAQPTSCRAQSSSDLRLDGTVHWQDSAFLTKDKRAWWKEIVEKSSAISPLPKLNFIEEKHILHALAWAGIPPGVISSISSMARASAPCDTVGKFFQVDLAAIPIDTVTSDSTSWTGAPSWETCFHSTSLQNLPQVLLTGLKAGPNAITTGNKPYIASVYAEGVRRRHCSFAYSTHVAIPGIPPNFWFGVMLECVGDAKRRVVKNHQFAYEEGAVHINTAFVHCFDIRDAYNSGYAGTCRVHWKQYLALRGLSTPAGTKPFLADPRVYCKVHEEVNV